MLLSIFKSVRLVGFFCSALVLLASPAEAQRRDVVVMKNGDQISGEIKKIEHGQLYIKTTYAVDPLPVDWLQVERLESKARFRIELDDGEILTGLISKTPPQESPKEDFQISEEGRETRLSAFRVVGLQSQKSNFWRQLKGSVDFGFSYNSGSQEKQGNLTASASYFARKFEVTGTVNSTFSGTGQSGKTNRHDFTISSQVYLSRHSFVGNVAEFLTSDQQSLNLRTTLGGGYGRYFIRNNRTKLAWLGGFVFTKEQYDPSSGLHPEQKNVEALLGFVYDWFRFNRAEVRTVYQFYPGLSDTGRIRSNLDTSLSIKLAHDFYLKFGLWDTYDSKPPVNARKNELGISTTFGLKF